MGALNLDEEFAPLEPLPANVFRTAEPDRSWGDVASDIYRSTEAGLYSTGRALTGVLDMQTTREDPEVEVRLRERHKGWREGLKGMEEGALDKMTPTGRRRREGAVLPGTGKETIWGEGVGGAIEGIVSKAAGSAPSVVASLLATVFGGGVGGYVTAGAISAGDVYEEVRDTISNMPAGELAEKNPLFAGYLSMGVDEETARDMLLEETARNKAMVMGVFTAASSKFLGIEGRIAGGAANRVTGRLAAAGGEAVQEGAESAVGTGLGHYAKNEATGTPKPFDWYDLANKVAEGALVGGVMGGALGGGRSRGDGASSGRSAGPTIGDVDPAVASAADATINPVVTPEVTPEPDLVEQLESIPNQLEVPTGTAMPAQPGRTAPAAPEPDIQVERGSPAPPLVDADVELALTPTVTEEGLEDAGEEPIDEDSVVPPIPVGAPVVTPQVAQAIGSAGVGQPLPETAATTLPDEAETPPAANVEPVEAIEETPPVVGEKPRTGRVIPMTPPQRERKGPRMSKKMREQVEAGKEVLPAREAAKRDRAEALQRVATTARANIQAIEYDPASMGEKKAMLAYVREIAKSADPKVSLNNLPEDADPVLKHLAEAKKLSKIATTAQLVDFMVNDLDLRRGGNLVAEYRKAQSASGGPAVDENVGAEGIETRAETATKGAVRDEVSEGTERKAYDQLRRRNPTRVSGRARAVRELRRSRQGQVATQEQVRAADEATGKFAVAENKAGTFKVEKRRSLKRPGQAASNPAEVTTAADIKKATAHVETPTPAQAEAENYRKAHLAWRGLEITGETKKGGVRKGVGRDGKPWSVRLKNAYGYIKRTTGADKDQIDIYLGDHPESDRVWVVDQVDADTKKFDEHKALGGFRTPEEALAAYRGGFSDGRADERIGGITEMTREQFRQWVESPQTKPLTSRISQFKLKADVKRALKQKTAQTEAEAETQLKEDILRDNQDELQPEAPNTSQVVQAKERIDKILAGIAQLEKHPEWADPNVLRRLRRRTETILEQFRRGETQRLIEKSMRRSGLWGDGALRSLYVGSPQEAKDIATDIDNLGNELEDVAHGDILPSLSDEEILEMDDENLAVELFLARQRAQEGPRVERKSTLRRLLKENPLPQGVSGHNRLMMVQIRDRIIKLAADVPVRILDRASMFENALPHMERRGDYRLPNGYYDPQVDEIVLLDEAMDIRGDRLILHEGAHAVYEHALHARPEVRRHIEGLMEPVRQQFLKEANEQGKKTAELPYGLTNSSEFVSEAFSNPEFQDLLARTTVPNDARVPYKAKGLTAWTSFLRQLGEILWRGRKGFRPETALEQIARVTEHLDENIGRERTRAPMLPSFGSGPLVNVKNELANYAADHPLNDDYNFRRIGLVAATFDTIQRNFDELFQNNPLKRIQRAMDDMRQTAQGVADEGRKHAEDWLKLEYGDYQEARRAAKLANELTMANMNPVDKAGFTEADLLAANKHLANNRMSSYQARKRMMRLNAEFMALKPATRQMITSSGNWFRSMQNRLTRANIDKLLNLVKNPLTAQQRADLITKVSRGRLDDTDKALIGDDTLFKAMQHASELRVIDGIYFPLMRHGNFVVTTRDKIGNLHGGTLVPDEQDVIEWRAPNEKAAKKLYQAFANDPNSPTVTSTGMVRYEIPSGKVLTAANAKGVPHEIGFRARVNVRGVQFFESQRAAKRFIRESRDSGQFDFVSPKFLERDEAFQSGELTTQQMRSILNTVERRDDLGDSTKQLLHGVLKEAAIRQLSGNRIQQRALPRRNVKGASEDVGRNMVMYGQAAGNYYARVKHMDDVRAPLEEMNELNKSEPQSKDRQAREQVINEVEQRALAGGEEEMRTWQWVRDAYTLSYLYRLFSPAYSVINGMQPWMVTAPVLGGEYGFLRTGAALSRAYWSVGGRGMIGSGLANTARAAKGIGPSAVTIDTTDIVKSMRDNVAKEPDGQRLLEVLDEAIARGKIEPNAGQEVAAAAGIGAGRIRKGIARFDRVARQLPQAVEALNRGVTLVAAYRLHYAGTQNHQQSLEHAFNTMMSTQGDYSVQNNPRFFNHPLLKPAVQFKKFALMMGNLLVDLLRRALGKNPSRADRWAAARSLGGIVYMQVLMAGSLGLPGLELLKMGAMVAAALGIGDGWEDWERSWRSLLDRNLGKPMGEMLSTGVVGKLLDIDLSKRISLSDLGTFGEPKDYDKEGVQAYITQTVFGAPGSMVFDWIEGVKDAGEGELLKALSKMIPVKVVTDIAKATKGYSSGDMTMGDAVRQVAGFRSRRLAEEGYQTGVKVAGVKKLQEEAKALSRRYIKAETKAELMKIRGQIDAHNKRVEEQRGGLKQKVFPSALDRVRASNEAKRKALRGEARATQ